MPCPRCAARRSARSDKPEGYPYTADNQTRDLGAVISHLGLDSVVLVAHDASGPPAIDWALAHPERTAALVLLNTYYGRTSSLRPARSDLPVLHAHLEEHRTLRLGQV